MAAHVSSQVSSSADPPLCLCRVLLDECRRLAHVAPGGHAALEARVSNEHDHGQSLKEIYRHLHDQQRDALCLSGGGIRSATFALGIMQGLARHNLLSKFDYLSTASGGGYIGAWLTAWIHRAGLPAVMEGLARDPVSPLAPEPGQIQHLRSYSNYLSPRLGLMSVDSWTCVAMIVRNWLLNWLVIVPLLIAVLAVPRLVVAAVTLPASLPPGLIWPVAVGLFVLAFAAITAANRYIAMNLPSADPPRETTSDPGAASTRSTASTQGATGDPSAGNRAGDDRAGDDRAGVGESSRSQRAFLRWCLAPVLGASLALVVSWAWILHSQPSGFRPLSAPWPWSYTVAGTTIPLGWVPLAVLGVLAQLVGLVIYSRRYSRRYDAPAADGTKRELSPAERRAFLVEMPLTTVVTVVMASFLLWFVASQPALDPRFDPVQYAWVGAALFVVVFLVPPILFLPIVTRLTGEDMDIEWWSRSGGWFIIAIAAWLVISGLVYYGPLALNELPGYVASVGGISGLITIVGGFSSGSPAQGDQARPTGWRAIVANNTLRIAATIFAAFLVAGLSWLTTEIVRAVGRVAGLGITSDLVQYPDRGHWQVLERSPWPLLAALIAIAGYSSWRMSNWVKVNKFSLHALYRNRLIRAYLGASHLDRKPNPFTGFDEADNIQMRCLRAPSERKLFHVIGITLNVVAGQELAWQERKAASFTISPLHAGSWNLGYRRTVSAQEHGTLATSGPPAQPDGPAQPGRSRQPEGRPPEGKYYGGQDGVSLGTAITISGAAASPNMGYQSSAIVAFMMTLFNVRLGWWLGNPGPAGQETYQRSSPEHSIVPLVKEAFGLTDRHSDYVYLSDGGHFENLGLYEMVLRRCRLIVVCDAGQDTDYSHESLGAAIRKIRIDMGIQIEMGQIRMTKGRSEGNRYCAVGTIRYSCVDNVPASMDGTLIYVKPIITGRESSDVLHYAHANREFPQESTGDQFFGESQFESYRELGRHAITLICGEAWELEAREYAQWRDLDPGERAPRPTPDAWEARTLLDFKERVKAHVKHSPPEEPARAVASAAPAATAR